MQTEQKSRKRSKRFVRIFLKSLLFLFLFVVVIFLLLLTPPVQRFLSAKAGNYLEKKLQTRVEIGRVSVGLSGNVRLEDVYIEDRTRDTLVSGGTIKGRLNIFKLFSNEVRVQDLVLQDITLHVKRILPDTIFNFQFIVDAFTPARSTTDTSAATPVAFEINNIGLENINILYRDVITGSDMTAHIGALAVEVKEFDPYAQHFDLPVILAKNITATIRQAKPLVTPESLATDIAEARSAAGMDLKFGDVAMENVNIRYDNDVSAVHGSFNVGILRAEQDLLDLRNNRLHLDELVLQESTIDLRLGKKETTDMIVKEVSQEATAHGTKGWDLRVGNLQFDNNHISFNNEHLPATSYGIDYDHLDADSFTLHVNDLVMSADSIGGRITRGSVIEKSGFRLQELRGDVLYAHNEAYLKDLYIRTPGTELKRSAELQYASYEELVSHFERTVMNVDIEDSRVQVRDILDFAPALRSNPAFSNPADVWLLDISGNGTIDRLNLDQLYFDGLSNTVVNASGTLTGLYNTQQAGGNFIIRRLHTTQNDIALFTGKRLSTPEVNIPETFDVSGSITGSTGTFRAALGINTPAGALHVDGRFSNLSNPATASYDADVRTVSLQLGEILRDPAQFGSLSGNFHITGTGFTQDQFAGTITGNISSLGYNRYQYQDIAINGNVQQQAFSIQADINDPNADMNITATGKLSGSSTYTIQGMVDSLKTEPLHLTNGPLVVRGKIDGTITSVPGNDPEGEVLITEALFVSGIHRQVLDTVRLAAGRTDSAKFIRLNSDVAHAEITGNYLVRDLPVIFQNSFQSYFTTVPAPTTNNVSPYDFRFTADVAYSPVLGSFMPGLSKMDPVHASGSFSSTGGVNAVVSSPYILYNGTTIHNLHAIAATTDSGLVVTSNISRVKSGALDLYNARINATAMNRQIDFAIGIDDKLSRNKYYFSGLLTQQTPGTYAISVGQDSLLLNYETWTVSPGNQLIISPGNITARNFVLERGNQRLALNSTGGMGSPVQIDFGNFRLATITGFVTADSLLADGLINGELTLQQYSPALVFTSDLTINDLSFRQDTIGNVHMRVNSAADNRYITHATITGRGNDVQLEGSFRPAGNSLDLDMNVAIRQLQLNSLEAVLSNVIENSSGTISGDVRIAGNTGSPDINGDLAFNQASFILTTLGSRFNVDKEKITVNQEGFVFDRFAIRDSANNSLVLDGKITTGNFVNYAFDLDVDARNFQVLNSVKGKDKIYYGKMNVTTNLHIGGTELRPVADGSIVVNEGTDFTFVVPQVDAGIAEREGIVQFVDMDTPANDSLFLIRYDSLNNAGVLGFDVAVNIEVKKEAIFNIVVDEANGDFLHVQGEAILSAGIDPSGKITLAGTYTLEQGAYQISFNFLQRKFEIQKGSTILWTGEPTSAQLNMSAVYVANTAPLDLVADQLPADVNRNIYMQKLPFEVHLSLTGELMKPVIDFDILLPEKNYGVSNDIVTAVQSRLSMMRQDEGDVNKQVFSLLLLNRFVGENPFESNVETFSFNTYARQSVSKLLTEQLNQLAAGLVSGVDINFDVTSSEDYTTGDRRNRTDLNVGLSKRLMNDRLKITVGSNFQLEGSQPSSQQNNNIAGNVAVDYQLSKDGRYMLRFYRQNEYQGIVDGYIIETGVSFILSVDYNRFMQIFRKKRRPASTTSTQNP